MPILPPWMSQYLMIDFAIKTKQWTCDDISWRKMLGNQE